LARVFISFAVEDRSLRDLLHGQKKNTKTTIDFTDYSVKEPWDNAWKTKCRQRIKLCAGMIGIITSRTPRADGQLWELRCAVQENMPLLLIHGYNDRLRLSTLPTEISGRQILDWTEYNLSNFLDCL